MSTRNNRLTIGDIAPNFIAETWDGKKISLEDYRGKKIWLGFYRYASCPLCNMRINNIIKQYQALESQNLIVLAVFESSKKSMADYVGTQAPPFALISDPEQELYRSYKLETKISGLLHPKNVFDAVKAATKGFLPGLPDGSLSRIPGDFLINEEGVITNLFYGEQIGDHIPFEDVFNFLNK